MNDDRTIDELQMRAIEFLALSGNVAYQRMTKAEAVLLLIWADLPDYLQTAERLGKQAELIKCLDDWAMTRGDI